jgi:hypothetical protein
MYDPVILYEYAAHDMGTNALTMASVRSLDLNANKWHIVLASGGDDQAVNIEHFQVQINQVSLCSI